MDIDYSIIIPVNNDIEDLQESLFALTKQTYNGLFEVIVVSNNADNDLNYLLSKYDFLRIIEESYYLNSPYSARNRGIELSKGRIIVLLDATCIPSENWLSEADVCIDKFNADLIGSNVKFRFDNSEPTVGEFLDSIINIRMKESIKKGYAKTASLFVKKEVFEKVGMFTEGIRSGGDVAWTQEATNNGFKLSFCENSVVFKKARKTIPLIKKQYRVGKGQARQNKDSFIRLLFSLIIPPSIILFKKRLETIKPSTIFNGFKLFFVSYAIKSSQILGKIVGRLN